MQTMKLGKTGRDISRIGLGTWAIGGGPAWGGDNALQDSLDVIRSSPAIGVNLIDTAPAYNFGSSEKLLGQALAQMKREEVAIITKCGITWTREGSLFNKVGDTQLYKNLSKDSIMEEFEQSLERLGIDYVDIYMTHWQSVEPFFTPISETMDALNELKSKGLIKGIGAANVTPEHIREYVKYGQLDIVQGKYSILDRDSETELIPVCKAHGITFQAYSPLEQGLLSGAIARDYVAPEGSAQKNKRWFQPDKLPKAVDMLNSWGALCAKYDCSVANLAIAWILAQDDNINVLSGATTKAQLEENVKAVNIPLTHEDAQWMRNRAEQADA
ncbi:MAG: NADH-dependent methylglyoxal reductase [Christensenellales bacterium]|jgi:methylglyoxal reductase